jgi:toxin ParE1/3/4
VRLFWTVNARADRQSIYLYISAENPDAAKALDRIFEEAARKLIAFPKLGHPGSKRGTREWRAHRSYRVIYRIKGRQIEVLAVVHAARNWPEG